MSRRSRRKTSSSRKSSAGQLLGKWFIRSTIVIVLLAAVASVGGYLWLRRYLSSGEFHSMIVNQAETYLGAKPTLTPLRWDGFRVNTDTFDSGTPGQQKIIALEGIKTGIDAGAVTRGVWSIQPSRINKISLVWDTTATPVAAAPAPQLTAPVAKAKKPWYENWIPQKIETNTLVVSDSDLRVVLPEGSGRLHGTRWELEPTQMFEKCKLSANGGTLTLPQAWAPTMKLDQLRATYHDGFLYLTDATLSAYQNAHITLAGEFDPASRYYALEGSARDVLCNEVLPPDWKQRLSGIAEATFSIQSRQNEAVVKGHLNIRQGVLTALPVLDKLAAYSQSLRFRTLSLHDAEADFEITAQRITLTKVNLGSEGLAHMEGNITFHQLPDQKTHAIDGDFRVGLAPGTLATVPGAEEDVFLPGERGLLWAPMHLSGTLDDPKEDLSARLMAAAGARMFDIIPATGLKVLKYTQQAVEEHGGQTVEKIVEKSTDVLDQGIQTGTGVIDNLSTAASGVFDLLGTARKGPAALLPKTIVPTPAIPAPPIPAPPIPPVTKP